jgi:hypothetical protein
MRDHGECRWAGLVAELTIGAQLPWVVSAVSEVGNPDRVDRRTVGRAPVKSSKIVALQERDDDSAGTARFRSSLRDVLEKVYRCCRSAAARVYVWVQLRAIDLTL